MYDFIEDKVRKYSECLEIKTYSEFHKNKQSRDGVRRVCKSCVNAAIKNSEGYKARRKTTRSFCKVDEINKLKECSACKELKPFSEFYKVKNGIKGLQATCRACVKINGKRYLKNKGEVTKHLCKGDESKGLKECSSCKKMLPFAAFDKNKEGKFGLRSRCKPCTLNSARARRVVKRKTRKIPMDGVKICNRCGVEQDIKKFTPRIDSKSGRRNTCISCQHERAKVCVERNPNLKLGVSIRSKLSRVVQWKCRSGEAVEELGCSYEEFRSYIESKFYPHPVTGEKMTWSNRGRKSWHIDHIKSLNDFNLSNRSEFLKASHYTNIQPLWVIDHHKKHERRR